MAVADIDFRLTYPKEQIMPVWHRSNIQGITSYQLPGKNTPIVLLHGLFSDGSDLFNLGIELNQKTGRGIMIVDLPGLGRSPFQKGENTLDPYRQMIPAIKKTLPKESIFIGHSFGAALLIEAYAQQCLSNDDKVILLQPPINKVGTEPCPTLSKIILRTCSMRQLATYFHRKGLWLTHEAPNHDYLTRLKQSFRSPRILNTTLQLNQVLKKMNLDKKISPHFHVIWGTLDKSYTIPTEHKLIEKMPYGHYFPISHPNETANAIAKIINT
jgi:pimeloyl-ACP methyl ester carboxylesterase